MILGIVRQTHDRLPAESVTVTAQWLEIRPKQARRPLYSVLDLTGFSALTGKNMRNWRDALRDYRTECEK